MRWRRSEDVDILVVCTGNVCRSPYIAARLRQELPELVITSAGTGALVGQPPTSQVRDLLGERGIGADELPPARALRRVMVRGARLIITATRSHRVQVTGLDSTAADRAFTLLELHRYLNDEGASDQLGVAGVLAAARHGLGFGATVDHEDDLADPYGRSDAAYAVMAASVERTIGRLAVRLSGPVDR